MEVKDALLAIVAVLGMLSAPIVFCFYKQQLDILDEIRAVLLRQKGTSLMISPIEFMQLERRVRGGSQYLGNNGDVISLMYPKRYLFNFLGVVVHVTALLAFATLIWRVVTVEGKDATAASFFGGVDETVPISVFLLAVSIIVYIVTLLIALNQKQALRRRISELTTELEA